MKNEEQLNEELRMKNEEFPGIRGGRPVFLIPSPATPCHPERSAAKSKDLPKATEKLSKMSRLRCAPLDRTEKTIPATATSCHPERSAAESKDLPKGTEILNKMSRLRCAPLDMTGERNSSFFVLHSSLNPAPLDKTEKTIPATATSCHPERSAAKSKDLPKYTEILNKMSRLRCAPLDRTGERNSSFFVLHSSFNCSSFFI